MADARVALSSGSVEPALKWVPPAAEAELRDAFARTLAVRTLSDDARELADLRFFETLVRLHRAGEGAPFTGLQPAGSPVEPIVLAADRALAAGSDAELVEHLSRAAAEGVRQRFARAVEARRLAGESVESGRRWVATYVELTHWLERLERDAATDAAHGGGEPGSGHRH